MSRMSSLLGEIDVAIRHGDHVDEIDERLIEPDPELDVEQKAALWLYAFSRQRPRQQGRMVRQHLLASGLVSRP